MKRGLTAVALAFGMLGTAVLLVRPFEIKLGLEPLREQALTLSVQEADARAESAQEGIQSLRNQSRAFVEIAKEILPAVVSINSVKTVKATGNERNGRFFGDDFFNRFFDQPPSFSQRGSGSGVIVDRNGYILTNNHVVANADELEVVLRDGRTFKASLIGRDEKSDVAVIKIDASELTAAEIGDSDHLEVGEWVLACGNPFQLSSTVTAGIVSAIGRTDVGLTDYEDFIQTDAAINPGNSGGALVNLDGQVVGINTAIATRTGGYQGVGFAIPINMAKQIMDSLIRDGKVVRGWMGVNIQDLNDAMTEYYGLDRPSGALVGNTTEDSPAERAGLKQGDLILEIDGEPVKNVKELRLRIAALSPGTDVRLGIMRERSRKTVTVRLAEFPGSEETGGRQPAEEEEPNSIRPNDLGLALEDITQRWRRELDLPSTTEGAIIADIDPSGPAANAGFRPGDIVIKVGDQQIATALDVEKALRTVGKGKPVLFLIERDGSEIFLALRLPE
ncbi:MAG: DegQ family serine endoprotease [Candidatus Eisenbacteria bacterium]|nr:DegQ family serine endoprotease [Candidatus Eisenbacteria bacterium]